MSLLKQQKFLAKLYTNEDFRKNFIAEPETVGRENGLDEKEIEDIVRIYPEEIESFAESLFYKRLREVETFLPLTKSLLRDDFEKLFREFINKFNPQTVKKHLEDAVEFAGFLQARELNPIWLKDILKLEQAKLEFNGLGKKFIFKKFDFDIRNLRREDLENNLNLLRRKTFGIWFRIGKRHQHKIF